MENVDAIVVKEKKADLKKIWNKVVKIGIGLRKVEVKLAPMVLKVVSLFVPEAAPVLDSVSGFLLTDVGKKLTDMSTKGYDTVEKALTGNFEGAKKDISEGIKVINVDEGVKTLNETRDFINKMRAYAK